MRPFALSITFLALTSFAAEVPSPTLKLTLRSRVEEGAGSGRYNVKSLPAAWDATKTAVVICDMWDKHWCDGATKRVGEMAPRMNDLVVAARQKGALIIHAPSDTMDYYKTWPQYALAQNAPVVATKSPLQRWRKLDPAHESPLPIDDTDNGCDVPGCKTGIVWKHQIDAIKIEAGDAITDSAQAYHLMRQRGIENVLVMGVHLNMCVLGRPFSIRQLVSQGLHVALVRDMTDTMYNPEKKPFVAHCTGTDLMVEHVEKFWCPTISSDQLLGGGEFRFAEDKRPRLLILTAEEEYKTDQTLPKFALAELGRDYSVTFVYGGPPAEHRLQGLEQLSHADALLVSARRRILDKDQLDLIRNFVASGKPLIAIRTACHAFAKPLGKTATIPAGCDEWPHFDQEVLGCNYANHYPPTGSTEIAVVKGAESSPLFKGLDAPGFTSAGSLYKVAPLDPQAVPVLQGTIPGQLAEFVAWTLTRDNGQRIFATTLGHTNDFELPQFKTLLKNGIAWATNRDSHR